MYRVTLVDGIYVGTDFDELGGEIVDEIEFTVGGGFPVIIVDEMQDLSQLGIDLRKTKVCNQ